MIQLRSVSVQYKKGERAAMQITITSTHLFLNYSLRSSLSVGTVDTATNQIKIFALLALTI